MVMAISAPFTGFPIVGVGHGGTHPPHPTNFFKNPPSKLMPPMGCTPFLKMKPSPSEKQPLPPLKCEAPFHEMIPRKRTITNNLKSS